MDLSGPFPPLIWGPTPLGVGKRGDPRAGLWLTSVLYPSNEDSGSGEGSREDGVRLRLETVEGVIMLVLSWEMERGWEGRDGVREWGGKDTEAGTCIWGSRLSWAALDSGHVVADVGNVGMSVGVSL